jgi:hypothetical protein
MKSMATSFLPYFNNNTTLVAQEVTGRNNLITSLNIKVMRSGNDENPVATKVVQSENKVEIRLYNFAPCTSVVKNYAPTNGVVRLCEGESSRSA